MLTYERPDGTVAEYEEADVVALLVELGESYGDGCPPAVEALVAELLERHGPHLTDHQRELLAAVSETELMLADTIHDIAGQHGISVDIWPDSWGRERSRSYEYRVIFRKRHWGPRTGNQRRVFTGFDDLLAFVHQLQQEGDLGYLHVQERRVSQWQDRTHSTELGVEFAIEDGDLR